VISPVSSITTTGGNPSIGVTSPAAFTNIAVNYKVYIGTSATGPFYLQTSNAAVTATAVGVNSVFGTTPYATTGVNPQTSNTTGNPGETYYYVDPGAATKCLRIVEVLGAGVDPQFGITNASGNVTAGPVTEFQILPSYCYIDNTTLTPYTAN